MDYGARDRLARHQREMEVEHRSLGRELRDVGTSAFAGLVVPQYLTDLYAPDAKAGRVFANQVRSLPLPPDGMTVNISRITTATAVASQTQENANVSETDIDDTLLTVNVRTIAGQQDATVPFAVDQNRRQRLERALGMTLGGVGRLLRALGCHVATNLDGGSSKRMVVEGRALDLASTEIVSRASSS